MIIKRISFFLKEHIAVLKEKCTKKEKNINYNEHKYYSYYSMMCEWMAINKRGKSIAEYLSKNNYTKIAVYGCGRIGMLAIDELLNNDIDVKFIIDRNMTDKYREINIVNSVNEISQGTIDAIVITTTFEYLGIARELCEYTSSKLISLEDMIHSMYRRG